jgi:hypothetical protein
MRRVSTRRSLAKLKFVGAFIHGSAQQSVGIVSGGSGLESVQKQQEIVEFAPVTSVFGTTTGHNVCSPGIPMKLPNVAAPFILE